MKRRLLASILSLVMVLSLMPITAMADGEDDYTWLKRGYATMTVLTYDLTHDAATKALEGRI